MERQMFIVLEVAGNNWIQTTVICAEYTFILLWGDELEDDGFN